MTLNVMTQIELAGTFAEELEVSGHKITIADLLDTLAICNLQLVESGDQNVASEAYFTYLKGFTA